LPEFDPTSNGQRLTKSSAGPEARGRGVVLVAVVSAFTGISLLAGATAGALVATALGVRGGAFVAPMAVASGLAAGIGVWAGVRMSDRFARPSSSTSGRVSPTVGGIVGLVAAVAIASRGLGLWAPLVVILLPGLGALLGDTVAGRHALRQRTPSSRGKLGEDLKVPPAE
jgi:uncharacterized membrane protein